MYQGLSSDIQKVRIDRALHALHKKGEEASDFGMDGSSDLLEDGFGLYSTKDLKPGLGPVKTEYFRISLTRAGQADFGLGAERHRPVRNSIMFGFPGQVFSLHTFTPDFFAYYMLFSEQFVADTQVFPQKRSQYPFLTYAGQQCFGLNEETAVEIEAIIHRMNAEIKANKSGAAAAVRLYIQLILILANRDYGDWILAGPRQSNAAESLVHRFTKLVGEHFLTVRKVADYAAMLNVSRDHLNRIVKACTDKTAHEFIDEMLVLEAKAYLRNSALSVAEIGYRLEFADPSHFNKFFKKLTGTTPQQFRGQS